MKNKQYFMGVNGFPADQTGACILEFNNLKKRVRIVSVSEERLTRIKYENGFPWLSIRACLGYFGIELEEIEAIAFDYVHNHKELSRVPSTVCSEYINELESLCIEECKQIFVDHHVAHARAAQFSSGCGNASILVVDGFGSDFQTSTAFRAFGSHLEKMEESRFQGIGALYSALTGEVLGFGAGGEGKTMGLAAYGHRDDLFRDHILNSGNGLDRDYSKIINRMPYSFYKNKKIRTHRRPFFIRLPNRDPSESALTNPFPDIARSIQKEFENSMLHMASNKSIEGYSETLCISGGCGLNVQANQFLNNESSYENIWVFPACSDSGIPYGLAIEALLTKVPYNEIRRTKINNVYYGPASKNNVSLDQFDIVPTKVNTDRIGKLLDAGLVLGVCVDRSELGPRALGHRSILADARKGEMRERLNKEIKGRELWRPFAPLVIEKYANKYFEDCDESPFMMFSKVARYPDLMPAAIHEDGTARVQTVTKRNSKILSNILENFYTTSGVPVLVNTSFNRSGEPIVESDIDAAITFLGSSLDGLLIDDGLILRSNLSESLILDAYSNLSLERERQLMSDMEFSRDSLKKKNDRKINIRKARPITVEDVKKNALNVLRNNISSELDCLIIGSRNELDWIGSIYEKLSKINLFEVPEFSGDGGGIGESKKLIKNILNGLSNSTNIILAWYELEPFIINYVGDLYNVESVISIYPFGWHGQELVD
jgi:carbamoyltransferase